jgi:hypothetical protein
MATDANSKNNRNYAALTLTVSEVITRNGKVIGKAALNFTPKGKPAFDLPVTLMAEEGSAPAKGIKVGQVNAMGALLYKEEEYQGKTRREYTLWADKVLPVKEGKIHWHKVTFTGWIQTPLGNRVAGLRYSDTSGEPFATHTLAVGMGKDKKKLYIDIKGVTVKGDSSMAMAMAEAEPCDTVRVSGTLDANKSSSDRIFLSVVVFPPFEHEGEEGEEAREPELPFEIVKKGEPRTEAVPSAGASADPFASDPFAGEPA